MYLSTTGLWQLVLRVRVPDSHSDVPLGEKYGANVEACADLVSCHIPAHWLEVAEEGYIGHNVPLNQADHVLVPFVYTD